MVAPPDAPSGLLLYVGVTGGGKTYCAYNDGRILSARLGWPLLVISRADPRSFARLPQVRTVRQAFDAVLRQRRSAWLLPLSKEDVERVVRAVRIAGRVVLLVDDFASYFTASSGGNSAIITLALEHRHAPVWLLLCAQALSTHVPRELYECVPRIRVFRTVAGTSLDRLEHEYHLPREKVVRLPRGRYFEIFQGFR